MRLRHCLGALSLLAATTPAMADMYLFDGRAWTAGDHPASAAREPIADTAQGRIAGAMSIEPAHDAAQARFADNIPASSRGCALRRDRRLAAVSALCE